VFFSSVGGGTACFAGNVGTSFTLDGVVAGEEAGEEAGVETTVGVGAKEGAREGRGLGFTDGTRLGGAVAAVSDGLGGAVADKSGVGGALEDVSGDGLGDVVGDGVLLGGEIITTVGTLGVTTRTFDGATVGGAVTGVTLGGAVGGTVFDDTLGGVVGGALKGSGIGVGGYVGGTVVGGRLGPSRSRVHVVCAPSPFFAHTPTVPCTTVTGFALLQNESVYVARFTVDPASHSRKHNKLTPLSILFSLI
jgi:hypothetical protein